MDFISISQLLDIISKRIPLTDNWDSFINLPVAPSDLTFFKEYSPSLVEFSHRLNNSQIRMSFSYAYRYSVAARALDAALVNHFEHCPAWYDKGDTGVPKKNADCNKTVAPILIYMANSFDQKLAFYRRTGLQLMHPDAPNLYAHAADMQRLKQVGFYLQDPYDFLERIGIKPPSHDAKLCREADAPLLDKSDTVLTKEKPSLSRKIYSTKGERGNLIAGYIEEIIAEIQDDDPSTVFRHLRVKVEQSGTPFIEASGGYIEYEDNNGKIKRLTMKALCSRINRRRERLNKAV